MKKSKKVNSSKSHPNFGEQYLKDEKGYFSFIFGYFFYLLISTKKLNMSRFERGHFLRLPDSAWILQNMALKTLGALVCVAWEINREIIS